MPRRSLDTQSLLGAQLFFEEQKKIQAAQEEVGRSYRSPLPTVLGT
jgi:hypothetical protein